MLLDTLLRVCVSQRDLDQTAGVHVEDVSRAKVSSWLTRWDLLQIRLVTAPC